MFSEARAPGAPQSRCRGDSTCSCGGSAATATLVSRSVVADGAPALRLHHTSPPDEGASQRLQKFDDRVLLAGRQVPEAARFRIGLAAVAQDRVAEGKGTRVMHQPRTQAHAP